MEEVRLIDRDELLKKDCPDEPIERLCTGTP